MKIVIFLNLILVLLISSSLNAKENIKDIFLKLDSKYINEFSEKRETAFKFFYEKKKLQDYWKEELHYQIDQLDLNKSFIKASTNGDGDGHILKLRAMTVNKNKILVIVNKIYWDIDSYESQLGFYEYSQNEFKDISQVFVPWIKKREQFIQTETLKKIGKLDEDKLHFTYRVNPHFRSKRIEVALDFDLISKSTYLEKKQDLIFDQILKRFNKIIFEYKDGNWSLTSK